MVTRQRRSVGASRQRNGPSSPTASSDAFSMRRCCWKMALLGAILASSSTNSGRWLIFGTKMVSAFSSTAKTGLRQRQLLLLLLHQKRRESSSSFTSVVDPSYRKQRNALSSRHRWSLPPVPTALFTVLSMSSTATDESSLGTDFQERDASGGPTLIPGAVKTPATFVNFPFHYHELIDVEIESLTNRGWGVARYDVSQRQRDPSLDNGFKRSKRGRGGKAEAVANGDETNNVEANEGSDDNEDGSLEADSISSSSTPKRWVVMVPNVIPGEIVRVRIFRNFKKYSEGDLVHVLSPSADRVTPVCAVASECGGCQLQHMSIAAQRRWKTQSVQASLLQYGIHDDVSPTLGTEHVVGYRSKLTPHYQAPAKRRRGGKTTDDDVNAPPVAKNIQAIGFQRQTSRSIIDVTSCPIATPAVNAKYAQVRDELLSQPSTRSKGATLLFRQANVVVDDSANAADGNDYDDDDVNAVSTNHQEYLTTRVRGLDFTYQAGNFFQNNYYVLPLMVDHVVHHARAEATPSDTATPRPMTHLVDCYCGSGLFALSAAAVFETVVGIEINMKAVEEATANAVRNNIVNCQFRAAPAEAIFSDIADFPRDQTVVVLDPPRKGCSTDFLIQLDAFAPQRIVYMSCDPTTQARDAQMIIANDKYRITSVQPFDLFPQTRHIECLIIFERTMSLESSKQ